jgi:FkbH-like protein
MFPLLTGLPWLAEPLPDFRARCRAIDPMSGPVGAEIQFLACHSLDATQAANLGKVIARCRLAGADFRPLSQFRLGVLASSTVDLLLDALPAASTRHGVAVEIVAAPYDQVIQEAANRSSRINTASLDAVLILVDHRWLGLDKPRLDDGAESVAAAIDRLTLAVDELKKAGVGSTILQTIPVWPYPLFGSADRQIAGTPRWLIEQANYQIAELAAARGFYLLDVAALAEKIGTDIWFDTVKWNLYKLPFAASCVALYADMLGRLLGSIRGKARKCLVLDLDNTLWGGVIGDDGLEGIVVGQGSAEGEAFLAVQQYALDLRRRGVILAVSSKNDEQTALLPFRQHPDMLLREEHFAVFQANWIDKSSNLEAIARNLKIGSDSLVLLDDNPAERAHVRAALPMVAVPELCSEPSRFPWYVANAGYFEALGFSAEDRLRADSYAADVKRAAVQAQARDIGDYLATLDMSIYFSPFDELGRQRIVQLINKSNQFNLTTRRYTDAEIRTLIDEASVFTRQVRLQDRFGDLGMIAVVICRESQAVAGSWIIDTWLMSCRVLGRRVEQAMLAELAAGAARRGVDRLLARYVPTAKNGMVADHYDKLGFELIDESSSGERSYELRLSDFRPHSLPFKIYSDDAKR